MIGCLVLCLGGGAFGQTTSQKAAVQLTATVQASPARITLNWTSLPSTTSISIFRKLTNGTSWGTAIATPTATALTYDDQTATAGIGYEYKVVRVAAGVTSTGYISTGIAVPPVDYRGRMILLVDNTFSTALSNELATLERDLRMDGWSVVRTDLARTSALATVKSTVVGHYNADPTNTKAVFIIGHLAVPYSGNQAPDGHSEHVGAWPCDGYYGELNGSWTDNSVNNSNATRTENRNTPGDGKFDQTDFPSDLELQVGRIDFYNMPAFAANETELTRTYLNKLHNFKLKLWTPTPRALVFDNLQWVSNPLAASAWRSMAPLVGPANITAANQNATTLKDMVNNQSYLFTYGSGAGGMVSDGGQLSYNSADRVGTTQDFASISNGGVFNMSFGSYFGDWDNRNNFLRAFIASGNGLVSCWSAIPGWYFHHMGMGATVGQSTLATMNNSSLYTPLHDGWQSTIGRVHLSLQGDPSLRLKMLVPPSNLSVTNANGFPSFTWLPSTETVDGYHLYSIDGTTGIITRITTNPVTGTSFTATTTPFVAGREYMVRAVRLITEPSGSYHNLSLGASAIAAGSAVDCLGVASGTALPGTACNDGNACTINDTWSASCQCVGTSITPTATITASGATTFCAGGSVTLNANTGTGLTYQWRLNGTNISGATAASRTVTAAGSYTVVVTNSGCSTTSAATVVTVNTAPAATITAGGATTFCSGGSVALNANAGTGLTYQWRLNGTSISGATAANYTATAAGSYSVMVTSNGCSTTSAATTVTVNAAPAATINASGATSFCTGGSVTLNANTGTGLTYQWRLNGTNISGATAASYTATTAGSFTLVVTSNGCSTTSAATTVTVSAAPAATITAGGATTFCSGGSVTLNANTGTGLTYQWRLNGTNISGATAASRTVTAAGSYSVVVSNGGCSTTSAATTVTVNAAPAATITASGATSFCTGGSVALNANTGTGLTYQWRLNGTNISGATSASRTATTAGSYTVVVTSGGCSTTSAATTVTVSAAPAATITAGGATTFCSGGSVTLNANTGTGLTYQWRLNGTNISGATAASRTVTAAGSYSVVVSNGGCSTTSAATTVTVNAAPAATITASGATSFCTGGSVALNANTGTGLTYQWRLNGTNISGATSASRTATTAGSYTVLVTSNGCSTTSAATNVTVSTAPTATITNGTSAAFCTGGSVVLSASNVTGYTYQWSRNGTAISGAISPNYAASTTGTYTVAVTNGGCSATSSGTVVSSLAAPTATCSSNGSASTVSVSATGGTTPYSYSWNTSPAHSAATATVSASGSYTATVTGANGCASTCTTTITVASSCTTPRTVTQAAWGQSPNASNTAGYLAANWNAAFPAPNYLTLGCSTRIVRFTTSASIDVALPSTGTAALLPVGTTVNPGTTISNTLLGHLAALKITVRMDELDAAFGPSGTLLKNMVVASGTFGGWSVQQLINHADQSLGGCVSQHSLTTIASALANINNGYSAGGAGNGYLVCPSTVGLQLQNESSADLIMEDEGLPTLFPNPTMGNTTITIPALGLSARVSIELLSITGNHLATLHEGRMEAGAPMNVSYDASAWPQGAYLCRIVAGDRMHHLRMIVE